VNFDPAKNTSNVAKHGVSLARAKDMDIVAVVADDRADYGETRYRAFGFIDDQAHCLVFTDRAGDVRPISLRRAHAKEMKRYGL
jgi:uncharacterized DUF497 family protein